MAGKDLYAALGVARGASPSDIKKAYRKLARKHHPDVNPGDKKAEERFKEFSAAFEILSDLEKRKLYDEFGDDATKIGFDPEKAKAYRQWKEQSSRSARARPDGQSGFNFEGSEGGGSAGTGEEWSFNLEDLLGQAFQGRRRRNPRGPFDAEDFGFESGAGRRGPRGGGDVEAEMTVPLLDALRGVERDIELTKPVSCSNCVGTGHLAGASSDRCRECGGTGRTKIAQGPLQFETVCARCGGTGVEPGPICPVCQGTGVKDEQVRLHVKVPAGVKDGQKIRLRNQGLPGKNGGPAGDLLITVRVQPHAFLRRQDDDLTLEVPVSVPEAMFGAKIDIPTLDGAVKLTIPPGSQSGQKLRLKGKGAPGKKGKPAGDLYVVLAIRVPDVRGKEEEARKATAEIEKLYAGDVRSALKL